MSKLTNSKEVNSRKRSDSSIVAFPESNKAKARRQRSSDESTVFGDFDRTFQGKLARLTLGVTPAGLARSYFNWWSHWVLSPGKQAETAVNAVESSVKVLKFASAATLHPKRELCSELHSKDSRFASPYWCKWPYNIFAESFLASQQWMQDSLGGVRGVSESDERLVKFIARQWLDMMAPANIPWLNPEVIHVSAEKRGKNLLQGGRLLAEDVQRLIRKEPPVGVENFRVGKEVAITPGKVIFKNDLIELIRYTPTTEKVFAEPILIVPAWIMKYYILDLSPHNSMIRHLVDEGHTVYAISWKNPTSVDRDFGMVDYQNLGVMAAIDEITKEDPKAKVNAMGYCLGGTLLMIAAATMARDSDKRLESITLLASQVEYSEPGELGLFIGDSEIAYLEAMMADQGYLDTHQMMGAFQMLRTNDLVWSRITHNYLLGQRQPMNDLMAWNADVTRMPYRMHSEYLRHLYLHDDLAEGYYVVGGGPISLTDINVPIFCVATTTDHVAPWRSVFKVHLLTKTDLTFLLTSGGHNAGIVSEPGRARRSYQVRSRTHKDKYVDPSVWRETTPTVEGSWWPEWFSWLGERSGKKVSATAVQDDNQLPDAPGEYVLQR